LNDNELPESAGPGVPENVLPSPKSTISEAVPEADAVALARAITAINELPLTPEVKANLVRRLVGV